MRETAEKVALNAVASGCGGRGGRRAWCGRCFVSPRGGGVRVTRPEAWSSLRGLRRGGGRGGLLLTEPLLLGGAAALLTAAVARILRGSHGGAEG